MKAEDLCQWYQQYTGEVVAGPIRLMATFPRSSFSSYNIDSLVYKKVQIWLVPLLDNGEDVVAVCDGKMFPCTLSDLEEYEPEFYEELDRLLSALSAGSSSNKDCPECRGTGIYQSIFPGSQPEPCSLCK